MDVSIDSPETWSTLLEQVRKHGGMQVHVAPAQVPAPFASIDVRFDVAGRRISAVAQVVHIDGQNISLVFADDVKAALLDGSPSDSTDKGGTGDDGEVKDDRPLWVRYDEYTKTEKMKLARRGNADARRLIMRDRDPSLQIHLLSNPGLSSKEVTGLIHSGAANPAFVKRIMQRKDLMSGSVAEALVNNPTTPIPMAVQLVGKLSINVCRRIAKGNQHRMPILQAARKRVVK